MENTELGDTTYIEKTSEIKEHWMRFFALADLEWMESPNPDFDFVVRIPCSHSECGGSRGSHLLRVLVFSKPYDVLERQYLEAYSADQKYEEPHPAWFGDGPCSTCWEMSHGAGGGVFSLEGWVVNASKLWDISR